MKLRIGERLLDVRASGETVLVDGRAVPVAVVRRRRLGESWELSVMLGDRPTQWWVTPLGDGTWAVQAAGGKRAIAAPGAAAAAVTGPYGPVKTPMAGVVTALHVTAGQAVARGEPLAVVEAMKMRYTLSAEADGVVTAVRVDEKALVSANQVLFELQPAE